LEINAYNSSYQASSTSSVDNLKVHKENEGLKMQDFLNLLVAQMTNQDAMNPMDNTEFISQMAQFSSLQAMSDMTEMSMHGLATSLIGKNVVVADYNAQGKLDIQEGIVQKVTMHSGEIKLYVNDKEYYYSNVMEIKSGEKQEEDPMLEILEDILEGINNLNDYYANSNVPSTGEIQQ